MWNELLERIRRRNVARWVLAYLAGAWVALEVVAAVSDLWGWPGLIGRAAFVVLSGGLPAAALLAWYHGEQGAQRVSASEAVLLGGLVVLVLGGVASSSSRRRRA